MLAGAISIGQPALHVRVTPPLGGSDTTFKVSFRVPESTGTISGAHRYDELTGSASAPGGCIASFSVRRAECAGRHAGQRDAEPAHARRALVPGYVAGRVEQLQTPVCRPGEACPLYIVLTPLARFTLHVEGGAGGAAPSFGGLVSALACTPGPQRPGETTPYEDANTVERRGVDPCL